MYQIYMSWSTKVMSQLCFFSSCYRKKYLFQFKSIFRVSVMLMQESISSSLFGQWSINWPVVLQHKHTGSIWRISFTISHSTKNWDKINRFQSKQTQSQSIPFLHLNGLPKQQYLKSVGRQSVVPDCQGGSTFGYSPQSTELINIHAVLRWKV